MSEAYIIGALITAALLGALVTEPDRESGASVVLYAALWPLFLALLAGAGLRFIAGVIWRKIHD